MLFWSFFGGVKKYYDAFMTDKLNKLVDWCIYYAVPVCAESKQNAVHH